jgi:hypothetical protein
MAVAVSERDLQAVQRHIRFDADERILAIGKRHWIELAQTILVVLLVGLAAGLLAIYRGIGGVFLLADVDTPGLTFFSGLLLAAAIALAALWWFYSSQQAKRKQKSRFGLSPFFFLAVMVLLLAFWFEFQGGDIFGVDPLAARPFDLLNIVLIAVALVSLVVILYLTIDWYNDYLIVTNNRVIYDDNQFLVRYIQQQILIDDIQQVNLRADTYPAYWFNYGTLVVRSFSPRTLTFRNARNAKAIQAIIQREVNNLRKQQQPARVRRLLEEQVYEQKPPAPRRPAILVQERPGPIPWLILANPQINAEREEIIWRPSWVFLALQLLPPLGVLVLGTALLVFLSQAALITSGWLAGVWLLLLLVTLGWALWVREEWINDVYILTRQNIIDVDRRPFGPENRRTAPLGSIQDISFDISFIEQILGYGTVIIKTGGAQGGEFTFNHVPNPRGVQATINEYLTAYRKAEADANFQTALTLIAEYHRLRAQRGEIVSQEEIAERVAEQLGAELAPAVAAQLDERVAEAVAEALPNALRRMSRRRRGQIARLFYLRTRRQGPAV